MGALIRRAPAVILCVGLLKAWERNNQQGRLKELLKNSEVNMSDEEICKTYIDSELAQALASKSSSLMARTFENMGIAYGFMILEAMKQGLGACIVGELDNELVALNNEKYNEIKKYFGLDDSEIITAAIIVGIPAQKKVATPRKPAAETYSFYGA